MPELIWKNGLCDDDGYDRYEDGLYDEVPATVVIPERPCAREDCTDMVASTKAVHARYCSVACREKVNTRRQNAKLKAARHAAKRAAAA